MDKNTIIYISGAGHSGSTLLDILLGSQKRAFGVGELTFLPEKGIINRELCSCGKSVPECEVWSYIIKEWGLKRTLDLNEYIKIKKQLTSKRNIISSHNRLKKPDGEIASYIKDTYHLYNIIFKQTGSKIIVDSSKTPNRILVLKNIGFNVIILHITRRFGDVLNSYKKNLKKNLEAGVEEDVEPKKTSYILTSWFLKNFLTTFYSKNINYKKIKYEEIVTNPVESITNLTDPDLEYIQILKQRGPFYPNHLVAGNRIRMKDHIYISEKPMDTSYHRLNKVDKLLARCIDFFY